MKWITFLTVLFLLIPGAVLAEAPREAWVMCNPTSEVNVRERPNKHADEVAHVYAGDHIELSGKRSGKWYHCLIPCEAEEGWIREDYLSFTEPEIFTEGKIFETACGKLYARYSIAGNKCRKLKKGVRLTVYLMADEWSVTSLGYIMTEFLTEVPTDEQ